MEVDASSNCLLPTFFCVQQKKKKSYLEQRVNDDNVFFGELSL